MGFINRRKKSCWKKIEKTFDTTKTSNSISTKQSNMVDTIKTAAQRTDNLPEPKRGAIIERFNTQISYHQWLKLLVQRSLKLSSSLKTISEAKLKLVQLLNY